MSKRRRRAPSIYRTAALALVATAVALAGCVTPAGETVNPATTGAGVGAAGVADVVAHTAAGVAPVPPAFDALDVRLSVLPGDGAEPTLGVTSDGTIFTNPYRGTTGLYRSSDHGQSWEAVGDAVADPKANLDPWMWVDPLTDRVFNGPLYVACSWLAWSDDKGETWDFNPAAGCGVPAHDHQKITTGPPAEGVDTVGYPNVVYYAYNGAFRGLAGPETLDGTWVSVSLDGGRTFTPGVKVFEPSPCKSGINGPVAVAPDGTAYIGHATCQGTKVAVSYDSGMSWHTVRHFDELGMYQGLPVNPDFSVDEEGNAYLITPGGDGRVYMSVGRNQGTVWSEPVPVSPPHVSFTVFSVVASGEPGHVAFAYLGTDADVGEWERAEPSYASDDTEWHLYLTQTHNALDADPTFTTVQVTPDDDPVQRGCVWLWGGGNECRNLLDFIDMVEHEGRPYVVYTDGCDACESADESRDRTVVVAIVEEGPSLLGGLPLDRLVPDAGVAAE